MIQQQGVPGLGKTTKLPWGKQAGPQVLQLDVRHKAAIPWVSNEKQIVDAAERHAGR
jgi:hypothetical protein